MTFESLGIIETSSVSASLKTLSGISKEKEIEIVGKQILGGGIVTLFIKGELGAIKRAISFGKEILDSKSEFRSSHIIPLPHQQLLVKFGMERL
jgi:ethanolamine utilization protein EutM